MVEALKTIYSRGGVLGFYQGLIPWAWIEAGTKGAVLLFTASEFEFRARLAGASPFMVRLCVCVCMCGVKEKGVKGMFPLGVSACVTVSCCLCVVWYRWWYGGWYCSSLQHHGLLYFYEDCGGDKTQVG